MEYAIKAPQIGEVVQNLTLIKYHKHEGDHIQRDEPFIVVETDKATLDIDSPVNGIVRKLFFEEGTTVSIGETLAVLWSEEKTADSDNMHGTDTAVQIGYQAANDLQALQSFLDNTRNGVLPPRSKKHCLENKVIPISMHHEFLDHAQGVDKKPNDYYVDVSLGRLQEKLVQVFVESARQIIPANIQVMCDNMPIEMYRKRWRRNNTSIVPSRLEVITWSVIHAMRLHPLFCSRLINHSTRRQFKDPNIGIAVALDDDNLTTAVIQNVFSLNFTDFVRAFRESMEDAEQGNTVTVYHSLTISDLSSYEIINAIPVVTYPGMATLFVGRPYIKDGKRDLFNLSLSFDHRVVNGVGASLFLRDVRKSIKSITR